ncbi:MAG: phosphoenolpyruvate carboxykinase (ATP) [Geminicoccaceae bacterium]
MDLIINTGASIDLSGEPLTCRRLHRQLTTAALVEAAVARGEGTLTKDGALVASTGAHTGRSPKDKFVVMRDAIRDEIDWGNVNQPIDPHHYQALKAKVLSHLQDQDLFVQDLTASADPRYRRKVRVITEQAWHALFARNMFRVEPGLERHDKPDFTVVLVPSVFAYPERHGTRTETFILVDFEEKLVLIGGTAYAGEIKKSIFSILNYLLPAQNVLPMHCSANVGAAGDTAVFFGLSGTGKTTLSADPARKLIGDDEHGWSDRGIFNFEGGCYAKVISLSEKSEPDIWRATNRFGAIVENVVMDSASRTIDFEDKSITENTRSSYPLSFIDNALDGGMAGHPKNIVMLTADAFGVLPPVSLLSAEQAMYHFLSGYTAKVAGTEGGVTEPQATFSTCFGAPFMPRHPSVYASMLGELINRHGARCWLLNTGWTGGGYGVGERISLKATRAMLTAALDGRLANVPMAPDPSFGLMVPSACPDIDGSVLAAKGTWTDPCSYDAKAREVARRFETNFKQFEAHVGREVLSAGIQAH